MDSYLADSTLGMDPELRDAAWRDYKKHLSQLPAHYGVSCSKHLDACAHRSTALRPLPAAADEGRVQTARSTLFEVDTCISKTTKNRLTEPPFSA